MDVTLKRIAIAKPKKFFKGKIFFSFATTSRIVLAAALAGSLWVIPSAAETALPDDEPILCPNFKSADMGSPVDEYAFGRAYEKGYCGVQPEIRGALYWYGRAAAQGHVLAYYHLGEIYFTGALGQPDYVEAKKWYLLAAEKGHGPSQLRLGFLYAEGHFKGLTVDYQQAERWFRAAAEQDVGDARFRLGNFYHNYKNPPELDKAVHWLRLAAQGGNRTAMFDLSRMLKKGLGAPVNMTESVMWMRRAASLDMLPAEETLSEMYEKGDGVERDPVKSLLWTLKIAEAPTATLHWLNRAGDIFFSGWETIAVDYPRAQKFYERAAQKGDPHALARLGRIYSEGLGVFVDKAKGLQYLKRAAEAGDKEAKALLSDKK